MIRQANHGIYKCGIHPYKEGHVTSVKPKDSIPPRWARKDQCPFIETAGRMAVPGPGGGDVRLLFNGYKTSFCTMETIVETDVGGGCTA